MSETHLLLDGCKAVLWDFDGTLTRRPDMWCNSIAEACWAVGATHVTPEFFDNNAYLFLPWNMERLSHEHSGLPDEWWSEFLCAVRRFVLQHVDPCEVDVEEVLRLVRTTAVDPRRFELITSSVAVVGRVHALGIPQYVLSNHVPELPEIVESLFPGQFRRVWTSGAIGFEKPRVELFHHALDELSMAAEEVLMVGDDHLRDLEPARKIGMRTLHVSEIGVLW